ncbi:hypothetical protein [Herpetosiphon llansteffanensis]|uniref:hypothetical protein n=1 Tax=Herpetosiphon llansteffanensis TaxID=2094568 RepID=UPI000D7C7138|nr:hypothetical protein [Herpetosiphon llansteffanensis]
MMSRRAGILIIALVSLAMMVGLTAYALAVRPVVEQLAPSSPTLFTQLQYPFNASLIPVGEVLTVHSRSWGSEPIENVELWADGQPWDLQAANDATVYEGLFAWQSRSLGDHSLVARTNDATKIPSTSPIVRLNAVLPYEPVVTFQVQQSAGESIESLGKAFGIEPQTLLKLNPQLGDLPVNQPLGRDQLITVQLAGQFTPISNTTSLSPNQASLPADLASLPLATPYDPNTIWFDLQRRFGTASLPLAPEALVGSNNCTTELVFTPKSPDADGFFIYRAGPDQSQFNLVATVAANGSGPQRWQEPAAFGQTLYYVVAFNPAGAATSPVVALNNADSACASVQVPHFASLILSPKTAVSDVYCYSSLANGPWQRVPNQGFLAPIAGGYDLASALPLSVISASQNWNLECWGWNGTQPQLLGATSTTLNLGQTQAIALDADLFSVQGQLQTAATTQQLPTLSSIAPPTNLRLTTTLDECLQAAPQADDFWRTACSTNLATGATVLIWDWNEQSCFPTAEGQDCSANANLEGFQVSDRLAGTPLELTRVAAGQRLLFLAPRTTPSATDECLSVRAYRGLAISLDSEVVCLPAFKLAAGSYQLLPSQFQFGAGLAQETVGADCPALPINQSQQTTLTYPYASSLLLLQRYSVAEASCRRYTASWFDGTVSFVLPRLDQTVTGLELTFNRTSEREPSEAEPCNANASLQLGSATQTIAWQSLPASGEIKLRLDQALLDQLGQANAPKLSFMLQAERQLANLNQRCSSELSDFSLKLTVQP